MRAFVFVALLLSCGGCEGIAPLGPDAGPADPPRPTGSECAPSGEDTYESFGRAFFDAYCQRCHAGAVTGGDRRGAPSSHPFDTVSDIRRDLEEIDALAAAGPDAVNRAMPPSDPRPSYEERLRLGAWLACGAR